MTKARTLADNYAADINQVSAGVGITGGGTSGTVTITNDMATTIAAKGDLVVGTANDTYAALTVGSNNTVLTADSTTATGLKWATPSSGGMTLLASGSITGTLNLTSISQDYKELVLYLYDYTSASNNSCLLRLNNSSSGIYFGAGVANGNGTLNFAGSNASTSIDLNQNDYAANEQNNSCVLRFPNYTVNAWKVFYHISLVTLSGATTFGTLNSGGVFRTTTAISQINILNQTSGSYELYGVK